MFNDELIQKIKDAQIGRTRLTNLPKGVYALKVGKKTDGGYDIALVGNGRTVPLSVEGLAAMRVTSNPTKAQKVETSADAIGHEDIVTLQAALEANSGIALNENTKFEYVHGLKMIDAVSEQPIYLNRCYNKYSDFVKEGRRIGAMPNTTAEEQTARRNASQTAQETLRASGLKSGASADPKNLQYLPVFQVK